MQSIENIYEIDLTKNADSDEFAEDIINALGSLKGNGLAIKLKFDDIAVNQSQMVFIKSLIESYGHNLTFVETTNQQIRDICIEMDIKTTNESFNGDVRVIDPNMAEIKNSKLEDLREEFKTEENLKQTISVYRKADEEENSTEFQDVEVDFNAMPATDAVTADTKETMYVNQTLRNGQTIDYDGNVVVIGDCHPGSEIKATGDITIWGVLGSVAHAGAKGNTEARIRALKMNAVQLRIANCYSRRPDGGNIPYIVKSSTFTPEEARIVDDNVVLFKIAQN